MKRAEIDRKFDEIVAFAEIERFMDTPVKHYPSAWLRASSSGMYVRLAFAVAAHLEPEILLVDEVPALWNRPSLQSLSWNMTYSTGLAVGDERFRQKCVERK